MLSIENNELLTRVGPGTPMGTLMRHYWQPVCGVDDLLRNPFRTHEVKVLGEELVVYRDRRGNLGVVDKYCTHRRASLAYGVVENDGIRCQYHGWKFDATGRCVEQPFEDTTHPEDNFRAKCDIRAYKAAELAGLIFVYMGPEPAPLLPRWGPLVWDNAVRDIAIAHLPCSWLQCQENSLDTTHVEHLHGYAGRYFKQLLAGEEPDFQRGHRMHTMIGFDAFKYGIIKRRVVVGQDESHPQWRLGHPILFPNILWVGSTLQFRVPADDTHTLHLSLYTWRAAPGTVAPQQDVVPSRLVPLTDDKGQFTDLDITFNQDYMCWMTQGDIAKRHLEKLGESDRGIILFRKMLLEQVSLVQAGQEPSINILREPAENAELDFPVIPNEAGEWVGAPRGDTFTYHPQEAGYSRDADKIEAVMATWKDRVDELHRRGVQKQAGHRAMTTQARTLNVGVVGLGLAAASVMPAMVAMPQVNLVAGADINPRALQVFQEKYGAKTYSSIEALCDDTDIDTVWIATPNTFHCPHVILAAERGKHVIVEKPMAISLAEADRMIEAADRHGVQLLCGGSRSSSAVVRKMRQVVVSGTLGRLRAMTTWSATDWMLRPRRPDELDVSQGGGVVYRQAPHQVDSVRLLAGGKVSSVRGMTGQWMVPRHTAPGFFSALLECDNGALATLIYSAYGYFMASELFEPGTSGPEAPGLAGRIEVRQHITTGTRDEAAAKEQRTLHAQRTGQMAVAATPRGARFLSDLGLLVVSCEHGEMRQSPAGVYIYGDAGTTEVPLTETRGAYAPELDELYDALMYGKPVLHSGRWGLATLEVCLAIMQSAAAHRDIALQHQVAVPDGA